MPEFLQRFSVIWLAHIGPDDWAIETALHSRSPWRAALAFRQWRAGFNAGGPHKFVGMFSFDALLFQIYFDFDSFDFVSLFFDV